MSEYVALLCDTCGYKKAVSGSYMGAQQFSRFSWNVYKTGTKGIFPMLVANKVWCKECEAPVSAEAWPTIERIEYKIAEFGREAKAFRQKEKFDQVNANLADLFELFCANENAWRKFASAPRKTRCLGCGSKDIESLEASLTDGREFRFSHGGCESTLRAAFMDSGVQFSPKYYTVIPPDWKVSLVQYSTDGLANEKSALSKLKEKLPEVTPLLENVIRDEIGRHSGRFGKSGAHTISGENEYPEMCRELREFVAKEIASTWRPNEDGTLKADIPEIYTLIRFYVRQEIAKVDGVTPMAPRVANISAICIKCGSAKANEFAQCSECGSQPKTEVELAMSLVLSEHLSSQRDIQDFQTQIRSGQRIKVDPAIYAKARAALSDKQLMSMIAGATVPDEEKGASRNTETQGPTAKRNPPRAESRANRSDSEGEKQTSIHRSAFWLLGANVRDDRRRIVELAEEKALHFDHDACQKARGDLTNPRTRLAAEIAWMPGVSPKKAREAAEVLLSNPLLTREQKGFPSLAKANLMVTAFEVMSGNEKPSDVANYILELATVTEEFDAEDVLRDLNEDRAVSGFPEIKVIDGVEAELAERLRTYKEAIRDALNNMPPEQLVETMTRVAQEATDGGESLAPSLVDGLVDSYESETQGFLTKEAENLAVLVKKAREVAANGEKGVGLVLDRLEKVVRNWDRVAHPIQVCMKARGIEHRPSRDLAYEIRSLGIDLYNEHQMMVPSRRLIDLLSDMFGELPEVAEAVEKDAVALENIALRDVKSAEERREWEREIAFEQEIGLVFKDTLKLSAAGVEWKGHRYPLDSITRVRWGSVRHSVNGIPTGTDYTIAIGDNRSEAVILTRKEGVFTGFTSKLWRAVCVRLMVDLLKAMREGKKFAFGNAVVDDAGVELVEHHTFAANKRVYCRWPQVRCWSANGSFFLALKDVEGTNSSASYQNDANTHLIEHLIRMNFKGNDLKLSDALSSS